MTPLEFQHPMDKLLTSYERANRLQIIQTPQEVVQENKVLNKYLLVTVTTLLFIGAIYLYKEFEKASISSQEE